MSVRLWADVRALLRSDVISLMPMARAGYGRARIRWAVPPTCTEMSGVAHLRHLR